MNKIESLRTIAVFVAGAAAGVLGTWAVLHKRYESYLQGEINEIKKIYTYKKPEQTEEPEKVKENETPEPVEEKKPSVKPDLNELANKITGKYDYSNCFPCDDKPSKDDYAEPYTISPEAFGTDDDYDLVEYVYYADGYLINEVDEEVEDIKGTVGDALDKFGEYEEDVVYVRNDRLKLEFEIVKDSRNFTEVVG